MIEPTITANGGNKVPAGIRRAIGGASGTRLVWHVVLDSRLFVRVKKKIATDVKSILKSA